ncbi:MAG: hypothetical protein KBD03_00350 [Gammaproteobacteria bacterium]|nr:hypothetical protein [Gammaproteobacteria bacterium]
MSSNAPTQHQLKMMEELMEGLKLPKTDETHETYETLLKQEGKKLMAVLPRKIKKLTKKVASLTEADKNAVKEQQEKIKELRGTLKNTQTNLTKAKEERQTLDLKYASASKILLKQLLEETKSLAKNDDALLAEKSRSKTADDALKATRKAITALEANVAPDIKAKLEAQEAREIKAAAQSSIPKSVLTAICSREENSTFFPQISDTDFETLEKEAKPLVDPSKAKEDLTPEQRETISKFEFEKLKRDVKSLLARHQTEGDGSVLEVTKNEFASVSILLAQQKERINAKIKEEEEKAKKELQGETNQVENSELPPEVQSAANEWEKCKIADEEAKTNLAKAEQSFYALPAVALPKQLKNHTQDLENYQKKSPVNKAATAAKHRLEKIQQKNKLHETVKAAVVRQIKEDSQQADLNTVALERAVEYCIAQLEQEPPAVQKTLKIKSDKQPLTNEGVKMSDILEATYHTYLIKGLEYTLSSAMTFPEHRKEAKAYKESRLVPPPPPDKPEKPEKPSSEQNKANKKATLLRVRQAQQEGSRTPHDRITFKFTQQLKAALRNKNTDKKEPRPSFKPKG